jgi:hypothetical protein
MSKRIVGAVILGLVGLNGCADTAVEVQRVEPQPIGRKFAFDRYPERAYYQFIHAQNKGGKLEVCGISMSVQTAAQPIPTPPGRMAVFSDSSKNKDAVVKLNFLWRYTIAEDSPTGAALTRIKDANDIPDSLRADISALPAYCVVTNIAWNDSFQEAKLTGEDWPFNGFTSRTP